MFGLTQGLDGPAKPCEVVSRESRTCPLLRSIVDLLDRLVWEPDDAAVSIMGPKIYSGDDLLLLDRADPCQGPSETLAECPQWAVRGQTPLGRVVQCCWKYFLVLESTRRYYQGCSTLAC